MSIEYILFGIEEAKDIKKSLLQSQISALQSQQYLQNYRKLRQEELNHKIKLKSILGQAQEELQILKKLLPESQYNQSKHAQQSHFISDLDNAKQKNQQENKERPSSHKSNSMESQLDEIRNKLKMLS